MVSCVLFLSRPFELIAVASGKSVSIWRLEFPLDSQGRLVVTRAARLIDHNGEVLASTLNGSDAVLVSKKGVDSVLSKTIILKCGGIEAWELGSIKSQRFLYMYLSPTLFEQSADVWHGAIWSQVSHLDWDMTGMTLATSGSDGTVRLWQSNFSGQWQQQGIVKSVKDSYKRWSCPSFVRDIDDN